MSVLDHGPEVLTVIWSLTAVSGIVLGLRIVCKVVKQRRLWWDDIIAILSWLCLVAPGALTTVAIHLGLGELMSELDKPVDFSHVIFLDQISSMLTILGALWSKTSFGVTLLRVADGWVKKSVWGAIFSLKVFMVLEVVFTFTRCVPVWKIWEPQVTGYCWPDHAVNSYATFTSGAMDLFFSIIPVAIFPKLDITPQERIGAVIPMSMGIIASAMAFAKCADLSRFTGIDFSFGGPNPLIWSFAETAITIIASSIPVLRAVLRHISSSAKRYVRTKSTDEGQAQTESNNDPYIRHHIERVVTETTENYGLILPPVAKQYISRKLTI
ncbi:hypothetical protein BX600DRAFT_436478 [Xylariales sp. PMI_506]|nr:hypothetical protein BX600DRAFT_436478 [Xylariales sp. PMI_506]